MEFKKVVYSQGIDCIVSRAFRKYDIPYSTIVKNIATQLLEEVLNKISDMDTQETLYVTIIMDNKPSLRDGEAWKK